MHPIFHPTFEKISFHLDRTSSNINSQMLDDPTWVIKRSQHIFHPAFVFSLLDEMLNALDPGIKELKVTSNAVLKIRNITFFTG